MIRWVFFDVGNVLLDEDPLTYRVFVRHVEAIQQVRPELSFEDLLARREKVAADGSLWPVYVMASGFLSDTPLLELWRDCTREVQAEYGPLSPLIPGAAELVETFAGRYRLGVIANQPKECRARLEELRLLHHFDVVALSSERGVAKPDHAIFEWALEQAGAAAAECLMVGDRPDNDLVPAAAQGMATAWVRWPDRSAKGWGADEPRARLYLRSLERSAGALPYFVVPRVTVAETRGLQSLAGLL